MPRPRGTLPLLGTLGVLVLLVAWAPGPGAGHLPWQAPPGGSAETLRSDQGPSLPLSEVPSHLSFPLRTVPSPELHGPLVGATSSTVAPGPLRGTYGVDALLNASGPTPQFPRSKTLAVLGWGEGYVPSDLATFFAQDYPTQFPRPIVIPVPIDNATPPGINSASDPSNGARELTIDVEWSASMAPGATIYVIYAPRGAAQPWSPTDQAIEDVMAYAVALHNLTAVSMSFGEAQGSDPALEAAMEADIETLTANGTTVFASSGDDGGSPASPNGSPCTQGPQVDFPAASPQVVAVGGTNISTGSEVAWSLSGGGASLPAASDPAPAWQSLGSAGSYVAGLNERELPDVAASAAMDDYYFAGAPLTAYGTSFSSPLWAGILLDIVAADHQRFGGLDPSLYAIGAAHEVLGSSPFHDIRHGSNCYFASVPGWDRVTGWGSVDAASLAQALAGTSFAPLTLTLSPTSAVPSGATVVVTVANPASGAPSLANAGFVLGVLDPSNDSWALRLFGPVPAPGAPPWPGSFPMPSSLGDRGINLTVVAQNGSVWGVGSAYIAPPPLASPPGPSFLDLLVTYQLPILGGFLAMLVILRFYGDRRRSSPVGPSPRDLMGAPSAGPAGPPGGPGKAAGAASSVGPGTAAPPAPSRGSAEMVPFCWKCGATLTGKEAACPSCGTRFSS